MRDRTLSVLGTLNQMKPLDSAECRTWLEIKITKITNVLRWIGGSLFLALCAIALIVRFVLPPDPSRAWWYVAQALSIGSMMCALLWMALDAVPPFFMLARIQKYMPERRRKEAAHDLLHVEHLLHFNKTALRQAETWLSINVDRIKARMTMAFGGPDNLMKITLFGLSWIMSKDFPWQHETWQQTAILFGTAFFGGVALGGFFSLNDMRAVAYQKELATMALARLDDETMKLS